MPAASWRLRCSLRIFDVMLCAWGLALLLRQPLRWSCTRYRAAFVSNNSCESDGVGYSDLKKKPLPLFFFIIIINFLLFFIVIYSSLLVVHNFLTFSSRVVFLLYLVTQKQPTQKIKRYAKAKRQKFIELSLELQPTTVHNSAAQERPSNTHRTQLQQQQHSIPASSNNSSNMSDGIEVEQIIESKPRRMPLATSLDKDAIREAYEDVRSDLTDTEWAVFKFDGAQIIVHGRGQCFEEFRQQFGDSERAFGYIRIQMGDEISKRKKFIFLTWIGQEVGVIQRAKMSTDKALIKDVLNNFAVELQAGVEAELDIELFREALNRAGGANYGTGIRDN